MNFDIAFLPWLDRPLSLKIGGVQFVPFNGGFAERLPSEAANHLKKYFARYVDYEGGPVTHIALAIIPGKGLSKLNWAERKVIRRAVDALTVAAIAPAVRHSVTINNRSWGPPTSDQFQLFFQSLDLSRQHLAIQAGSTTHVWGDEDNILFLKPFALGGPLWSFDDELLNGLCRCSRSKNGLLREKVFRSLEWFRLGHVEEGQVSRPSRTIMMATAFEVILDFPENGKAKYFVDELQKRLGHSRMRKGTRKTRKGIKFSGLYLPAVWAGDFYDLRSKIVHGDDVPPSRLRYSNRYLAPNEKWKDHLIVADVVFYQILVQILFDNRLFGEKARRLARECQAHSNLDLETSAKGFFETLFCNFTGTHRHLGWLKKERRGER